MMHTERTRSEHRVLTVIKGADMVTGSTHKTFLDPQRGVILGNIVPGHVSNHHPGTLLGLLEAIYEMIRHRDEYQLRVIRNAKAFARALAGCRLAIEGDTDNGYTDTHQVLVRGAPGSGGEMAARLEQHNVITNPRAFYDDASFAAASGIRLGTQEMTRFGMNEPDFGELLTGILREPDSANPGSRREEVIRFRRRFTRMHYCL